VRRASRPSLNPHKTDTSDNNNDNNTMRVDLIFVTSKSNRTPGNEATISMSNISLHFICLNN